MVGEGTTGGKQKQPQRSEVQLLPEEAGEGQWCADPGKPHKNLTFCSRKGSYAQSVMMGEFF